MEPTLAPWITVVQTVGFPIAAFAAMGIFIRETMSAYRALVQKLNEENNAARERDTQFIAQVIRSMDGSMKENTAATFELAKAVGELNVRLESK